MEEIQQGQENLISGIPSENSQQNVAPSLSPEQQALMNKVVAREKTRAAENARREAETQYQRELEALRQGSAQQEQRNALVSRDVDADAIYRQVQEKFDREQDALRQKLEQQQLQDQMSQVANNYLSKINSGKNAYQDFDQVTANFNPTEFPQITFLLSGIDNAADVLYDLSKNPQKLAYVDQLASKSPKIAQSELQKLSLSIKDNREAQSNAQQQYNVSEPLDRLNPSRVAGNNGKMTVTDLRNQPWLRG